MTMATLKKSCTHMFLAKPWLLAGMALGLFGCRNAAEPPPGRPPAGPAETEALAATANAAQVLGGRLKSELQTAMTRGSVAGAARTCAELAQPLTVAVAAETGVSVGRASLRLRNSANAPPAWVAKWLQMHSPGHGPSEPVAVQEIVDTPEGPVTRVLVPISLEPLCMQCHGPKADIDRSVRAILDQVYPDDQATGYAVGELRGVLWATRSVVPEGE